MIAERTNDVELIKSIMLHPDIFATIAEDGQEPKDFEPDVSGEAWVAMYVGDELIGMYNYHSHNSVTCEIHAHILPEFRKEHAIESGRLALCWFLNHGNYQKLICQVPVIYDNVKRFCLNQGFQVEGVNRMSYLKKGKVVDQTMLGFTRDEIEAKLAL